MKKTLIIALSLIASVSSIHAAAITFGAVPLARTVFGADGSTVVSGGLVLVGTFANEGAISINSSLTSAANVAAISQAGGWQKFSLDAISTNATGKIGGPGIVDNSSSADFFSNKPLYLWVFNTNNPSTATSIGIFRATTATIPWFFPENKGGVGDSQTFSTTLSGAATVVSFGGSGGAVSSTSFRLAPVAPVPEPGTAALLLIGIAGFANRRRRV